MESGLSLSIIRATVLLEALNWRYATKIFDKTQKLTEEELNTLLEVLRLAPSSIGLQPWKFVIIRNEQIRNRVKAFSLDQSQITGAQ